ncbi:bifunctional 4-hydroxy-2-oxoglutarate aldolase/2-dehydro-3-deoxy-phosphogluconate aldolase [Simiduia sp. 21SJ11W-1]|uniref:bifunctional 4-hydroxy-2-oxoglutarate aldolase/2-dehydro-3-deoxy-phosphogluconate aldolase n=1 Tax=Simiduia sp. 21SJ11W-1 TaxID=2909669 RepID=UPI0020A20D54|nr:bifunctional 4-hydroxy-2-oxoglutarate aldolase/2-dehydro-3-deoxy-phosphogluconate aldolase [Simiduia sp. 21SJ11W-1]UTA49213.1 bifunctional 4-hydroxy-2-oxoglutarate aldolase/2-dehydro-3-deoxy-phosphogluconate aldolase [Simiduia sp. 21SJ11W-1]
MHTAIERVVQAAPVVPVMVIEDIAHAVPLAKALVAGGLPVLEITLRTECALEAIKQIKAQVPGAIVGAGTVNTPADVDRAVAAGSEFLVSPGSTPELIDAALASGVPILPGVNSPSEVMALMARGFKYLKFFPAEAAGGVPMLKSISGPLPQVKFCPTGGVSLKNLTAYLSLPNVVCVGGSWMAPVDLMKQGDWAGIETLAREARAAAEQ